ncbi:hypothetical protein SYNPS1DRAFT_23726 [Syncephalis pseudoplumigaleata]|uniref:Uncharacterized protein n=1 Tax=Syncephalis pseudoplumigaleata TaxID=1712513 RepID=A0A4P9YW94_9FUNG|nr:hypothetical protein SYNPS1DRAFT_23726 [Syncephalis pseudoplumigaleata]|eukprot:RKP24184.1 hypothetical protein SYNPS1DRAFT_23726 [Syncephalis pseudoplumigaleata]
MQFSNNTAPIWGPLTLMYRTVEPSRIPEGPPAIPVALLDQWASETFYKQYDPSIDPLFRMTAEEELGPWNEVFLAPGFIAYQWLYFVLILLLLLYTWARVIRLSMLKKLPGIHRMCTFLVASIYSVLLLVYLAMTPFSFGGKLLEIVVSVMSVVAFDLILFYWTIRGERMFSYYILVAFRILLAVHIVALVICAVFPLMLNLTWQLEEPSTATMVVIRYLIPNLSLVSMIVYASFALWFGWCAYRVKKHSKACYRFTQLSVFSALAAITYIITITQNYHTNSTGSRAVTQPLDVHVIFYVLDHTIFLVRSLICLCILGLRWPRYTKHTGPRLVLTGAQTAYDESDTGEHSWSTRFWQQIMAYFGPQSSPNTAVATANSQGRPPGQHVPKDEHGASSANNQHRTATGTQEVTTLHVDQLGETMYIESIPNLAHRSDRAADAPPPLQRRPDVTITEEATTTIQVLPATITHLGTIDDPSTADYGRH